MAGNITVTNNAAGTPDTVYVYGVSPKDVVKVYSAETGGKLLGSKTVSSNACDVTIKITQLGTSAGSVYISDTSSGCTESSRVEADYSAEPVSDAPLSSNITVTNNAKGTSDTVYVCGLSPSDVVKVYNASASGKLLGSKSVSSTGTDATVSITQLGTIAGCVFVSVTSVGYLESDRVEADYGDEPGTDAPSTDSITVTNNSVGTSDTVYVSGLNPKDTVRVYNAYSGGKLLGSKTVATSGTDATVYITQLGSTDGCVYVSVSAYGCTESDRTKVSYAAEETTENLDISQITIANNPKGTPDVISVTGLDVKDIIRVYSASTDGKVLGSATVAASSNSVKISVSQLGTGSGTVYISIKANGELESSRVAANYDAEIVTAAPDVSNITVTNNAKGTADTVYVKNLAAGDLVKVYSTSTGSAMIGSATAAGTDATVSITQLGTVPGSVYITVTGVAMAESSRVEADYDAELVSTAPGTENIVITNNPAGTADSVYVSGLSAADIVKVYNKASSGTVLGSATVAASATTVNIPISQLGSTAGSVYVSVTSTGKNESALTKGDFSAETVSNAALASNITVTNNAAGTSDTVYVTGLEGGDIVSVYRLSTKGVALATATVANGSTNATVSLSQLGAAAGTVYVTVTSSGCLESACTQVSYSAEAQTSAQTADTVSITNNYNAADVITVTGLAYGDTIKAYDASVGGNLLGTDTVTTYSSTATISVNQLGTVAGCVYITKTSLGKNESTRTAALYDAEPQSTAPSAGNVTITNNAGAADSISVIGLLEGDTVTVYKTASGSNIWGSGTVAASSSNVTISVAQLGSASGTVYISVTSTNASESARTAVTYSQETASSAPSADNVTVVNNYNIASTVTVTGLANCDIVKAYSAASGGTLLGTGTVSTYGTSVTISLSNIAAGGGTLYLSVTSRNETESSRCAVTYSGQTVSTAISANDVTIANNANIADTITVKNTSKGSIVNAYDAFSNGTLLGTATSSGTSAVITLDQLGSSAGTVYLTITTLGKTESARCAVTYTAETASDPLQAGNVSTINNSGAADSISITGLSSGDVIKVYRGASSGTAISSFTATGSLTSVISIPQLGVSSGSVYLTVATLGKTESSRTEIDYLAESVAPTASQVTIVNNAGISDIITVSGLTAGIIVNAYSDPSGLTMLGTATVASGSSSATISVSQLSSAAGYIYVSAINSGCAESSLTKVSYLAEASTDAPDEGNVSVVNNSSIADTVTVCNLNSGDVVKVYDASSNGNLLGKATAAAGSTSATVSISDLGKSSGSVYVTVKTKGKLESGTTEICYSAESQSTAPYSGNITIVNNTAIADTVTVTGLLATDLVKIYSAASQGTLLGYGTVASGSTTLTVSISQLGVGAGAVYVSVTESGKTESNRTEADYVAEAQSNELSLSSVVIVNNAAGTSDSITVSGLASGDVIQVYDRSSDGNMLGSAVATSSGKVTISIPQLGASAGCVYLTCTNTGKSESERTKINYSAE